MSPETTGTPEEAGGQFLALPIKILPAQCPHAERRRRVVRSDFLLIEFGNVIWQKVRLGELAHADGNAALAALRSGPVSLVDTTPLLEPALRLAHEIDHPVYDCLYLATAEAVEAIVATADR